MDEVKWSEVIILYLYQDSIIESHTGADRCTDDATFEALLLDIRRLEALRASRHAQNEVGLLQLEIIDEQYFGARDHRGLLLLRAVRRVAHSDILLVQYSTVRVRVQPVLNIRGLYCTVFAPSEPQAEGNEESALCLWWAKCSRSTSPRTRRSAARRWTRRWNATHRSAAAPFPYRCERGLSHRPCGHTCRSPYSKEQQRGNARTCAAPIPRNPRGTPHPHIGFISHTCTHTPMVLVGDVATANALLDVLQDPADGLVDVLALRRRLIRRSAKLRSDNNKNIELSPHIHTVHKRAINVSAYLVYTVLYCSVCTVYTRM